MTIRSMSSGLKIHTLLFGAAIAIGALAPLPAMAGYYNNGGYNDDQQDYQPNYRRSYRPHCYYTFVRVYDDYTGRYVKRRQRVCDRGGDD